MSLEKSRNRNKNAKAKKRKNTAKGRAEHHKNKKPQREEAMFQQGHFDAILREKQELRRQVFETRENIQELDAQINSLESSSEQK